MTDLHKAENRHEATIKSFGREWMRFDQTELSDHERREIFEEYFRIFPWGNISAKSTGFDMGCGSGRWARIVAPKVGHLHCIDASPDALSVARRNLASLGNISFLIAGVDAIPLPDSSQDFGYALGVLHHVPDTARALANCIKALKPGAPFLLYLYYALDNRSVWYRFIWRMSDYGRRLICRFPSHVQDLVTDGIAISVYWPLARLANLVERLGGNVTNIPLAYYRSHSFYTMRTDARDRFGTPLEQRFTRNDIRQMMETAGLADVRFSEHQPYWCAVGIKA